MSMRVSVAIFTAAGVFILFAGGGAQLNISSSLGRYVVWCSGSPSMFFALGLFLVLLYKANRSKALRLDVSRPAGIARRCAAFILDFVVYLGVLIPVPVTTALVIEGIRTGEFSWGFVRMEWVWTDIFLVIAMFITLAGMLFLFSLPVWRENRSVGQFITGYGIAGDERSLSLLRALLRTILAYITLAGFFISVPMALFRKDRRMWHDLVFKTYPCKPEKSRGAEVKVQ